MNILLKSPWLWVFILILNAIAFAFMLKLTMHSKRITLAVFSIFFGSAISLYYLWGASGLLAEREAFNHIDAFLHKANQDPVFTQTSFLEELQKLSKQYAYSHTALARLAQIYQQLGKHDQAIVCLEQAIVLSSLSPSVSSSVSEEYWNQWFYNHSLLHLGKLPPEVKQKALTLINEPGKEKTFFPIRNLLAIDCYLQKEYLPAIEHWKWILQNDETLSQDRKDILAKTISTAEAVGSIQLSNNDNSNLAEFQKSAGSEKFSIPVSVSLSEKLSDQVKGDDLVFVFITSDQKQPPLAVIKKRVSDLPFTVNLEDKHSMLGNKKISAEKEIQIVAKVSKTGDPLNKLGELRGKSPVIALTSKMGSVKIIIDEES